MMAELVAIQIAHLHLLLPHGFYHVVIFIISRCAPKRLLNDEHHSRFVGAVDNACRTPEDAGESLSLLWVPSHFGVLGNQKADVLAAAAHFDNATTVFTDRFPDARRMLYQAISSLHLDFCVFKATCPKANSTNMCWSFSSFHVQITYLHGLSLTTLAA